MDNAAFRENQLVAVNIGNGLTTLAHDLFWNNQLQSVVIPASITTIEQSAFENNQITNVVFNDNVTNIDSAAFRNNQITSVTIPGSVTTMGTRVFLDNPLTDVYSEATIPPTIFTGGTIDTFATNRSNIHLHIPAGTMGAYVTDPGALWTGFNPVTEDALNIEEFSLKNSVQIITANERIQIISDMLRLENYVLYSISGQEITSGTQNEIPADSFAKGVYILRLDFDRGTFIKKIALY